MENEFEEPTEGAEAAGGAEPTAGLGFEASEAQPVWDGAEAETPSAWRPAEPETPQWQEADPDPTGEIEPTGQMPPAMPRPFENPDGWSPSGPSWQAPAGPQPFGDPNAGPPTYWQPVPAGAPGPFGDQPQPAPPIGVPPPGPFGPQPGYGLPQSGYGQQSQQSFGQLPQQGYGPAPQPGFGQPQQSFGSPLGSQAPAFGYAPQPFGAQPPAGGGAPPIDLSNGSLDPAQNQPKTKTTGHKVLVGGLVGLLMLGILGAGIGVGLAVRDSHGSNSGNSTASKPIPNPATNSGSTQGKLTIQQVVSKVEPGVVDITSIIASEDEEAAGTGMILTSNGEVLTNNHVIAEATKITAQIDGKGRTYQVRVLGADPTQDVALVQLVGASGLKTVQVGNSSSVQVGESVVAIGNALDLQGSPTVTAGIISALNRSIAASDAGDAAVTEHLVGLLQTSAQINPGNSGGPLANYDGQVIGMNTAADNGSSSQAASSIGFAIPINEALSLAQQIQEGHSSSTVVLAHGFIGVEVLTISQAESGSEFNQLPTPAVSSGAYVVAALPGDPASAAGITEGSVITAIDGTSITSPTELGTVLDKFKVGGSVTVKWVDTSGTTHNSSLTLVSGPLP
jgi:S1-C subfamily serine protease